MKMIASDRVEGAIGKLDHAPPADFNERLNKRYRFIEKMVAENAHPFKVLDKFYEFMDKSLKEGYPPGTCKRGCSYCCHIGVQITELEARHIEARTGHKVVNSASGDSDPKENRPCVFLKNNECSIYEHRPAVCRMFISFDDLEYCKTATATHWMLALNFPGKGGFEWANVLYVNIIKTYLKREPKYQITNDIRVFFGN